MTESIFSQARLTQIVAETLPTDPKPGEKVMVGTVDEHGAQVVAAFKFNDAWELQAAARHDWNGDNSVGAKVFFRW